MAGNLEWTACCVNTCRDIPIVHEHGAEQGNQPDRPTAALRLLFPGRLLSALGIEYYNEKGTWRRFDTGNDQGKTLNRV